MPETDLAAERARLLKQRENLGQLTTEGGASLPTPSFWDMFRAVGPGVGGFVPPEDPSMMQLSEADRATQKAREDLLKEIAAKEQKLSAEETANRVKKAAERVNAAAGITPPAPPKPTPEPTTTAAGSTAPPTKTVLRLVTDPATGKQTWTTANVTTQNDEAGYQNALGQSAAARMRDNAAYDQAGRDMSTRSDQSGVVSPQGFASRMNTPGTYSYAGTQAFLDKGNNPDAYKPAEFSQLHELEQQRVLEQAGRNQQLAQSGLATREAAAQVGLREQALREAVDPVGFHQAQVQKFMGAAQQQLDDPNSIPAIRFKAGILEYKTKNPTATEEQIAEYAQILQRTLVAQLAEQEAGKQRWLGYGQQQGRPTDPMFSQGFGFGPTVGQPPQ
jgi:hypothetical protein